MVVFIDIGVVIDLLFYRDLDSAVINDIADAATTDLINLSGYMVIPR
jgi:hypothetical protein